MTLAIDQGRLNVDPAASVDATTGQVLSFLYRRLYRFDADGRLLRDLVAEETWLPDRLLLRLRDDEKNLPSVPDALFCLDRLRRAAAQQWLLSDFAGWNTQTRKPDQMVLHFKKPVHSEEGRNRLRSYLAMPQTALYRREDFQKGGKFVSGAVELLENNDRRLLLRSGDLTVQLLVIPDAMSRWFFFRRGLLDVYEAQSFFRLQSEGSEDFTRRDVTDLVVYYGAMVVTDPRQALADIHLRRAINRSVDRANLARKVLGDGLSPADTPVPAVLMSPPAEMYSFHPEKKRKWQGMISVFSTPDSERQTLARYLASVLTELGLTVKLRIHDLATILKLNNERTPGIYILKWVADFPHRSNFLLPLFHSANRGSAGNRAWVSDSRLDSLLSRLDQSAETGRLAVARVRELSPWVFFGFPKRRIFIRKGLDYRVPAGYFSFHPGLFGRQPAGGPLRSP